MGAKLPAALFMLGVTLMLSGRLIHFRQQLPSRSQQWYIVDQTGSMLAWNPDFHVPNGNELARSEIMLSRTDVDREILAALEAGRAEALRKGNNAVAMRVELEMEGVQQRLKQRVEEEEKRAQEEARGKASQERLEEEQRRVAQVRDGVQVSVTILLLGASLFVVLSKRYTTTDKHWAFGTVGTLIGYWLKS